MWLRTLGGLSLEGTTFQKPKPLLLLSYLALEGSNTRREIADLFFQDSVDPGDSLSTALGRLRSAVPDIVSTSGKEVATSIPCDAVALLNQFDVNDVHGGIDAYKGAFLKGINVPLGLELEAWVFGTREAIASRTREAAIKAAEQSAARGGFDEAARLAENAYLLAGAPEPGMGQLERIYLLLMAGGSELALSVQEEARSFGANLAISQQQARNSVSQILVATDSAALTNLPSNTDAFVGRDQELADLTGLLASGESRLVTIVGTGGIGKSRLAVELGRQQLHSGTFEGGIYLVQLENIPAGGDIPQTISDSLSVRLLGEQRLLEQLCRYFGDRKVLLIMDNFEHLVPEAELLITLLEQCPGISIIATSRQRLGMAQEALFALRGLRYPAAGASFTEAANSESTKLLASRMRLKNRGFVQTEGNMDNMSRICRVLEGMPLGIELAASWSRILPLDAIADEIEAGAKVLENDIHGVAERHRSLAATFDHSWKLLNDRERRALSSLVVFRSGFRREAASAVLGLTLPALAALVDKSLLRTTASGRYDLHPLLHQYVEEKAAGIPQELASARSKHSRYYLDFLVSLDDALTGGSRVGYAVLAIDEELANIRAAVEQALVERPVEELYLQLQTLVQFAETRARYWEVGQIVEQVLARTDPALPAHTRVRGTAKAVMALMNYRSGRSLVALDYALGATEILGAENLDHTIALWLAWFCAGLSSWALARPEDAADYHERGRQAVAWHLQQIDGNTAQTKHARMRLALSLHNIGLTDLYFSPEKELGGEAFLSEAIGHYRDVESPYICTGMLYLGEFHMAQGAYGPAVELLMTSLTIATQIGYTTGIHNASAILARLHVLTGNLGEAISLSDRVITQVRRVGDKWAEVYACSARGWSALINGDHAVADARLRESILAALESESYVYTMEPLLGLARMKLEAGHRDAAAEIIDLILRHPGTPLFIKRTAAEFARSAGLEFGDLLPLVNGVAEAQLNDVLRATVLVRRHL